MRDNRGVAKAFPCVQQNTCGGHYVRGERGIFFRILWEKIKGTNIIIIQPLWVTVRGKRIAREKAEGRGLLRLPEGGTNQGKGNTNTWGEAYV